MRLSLGPSARVGVQAGIKLARLLELPEKGAEDRLHELERLPLFKKLSKTGVLRLTADSGARFAARKAAGMAVREDAGLALEEETARLIEEIGQEDFTALFLRDEDGLSDAERAKRCGLSKEDAAKLRTLVDRLYIQEELEGRAPQPAAPPPPVCGAVAGISVEKGRPVLAFFHRDLWKGRYEVDARKREQLAGSFSAKERRALDSLLLELDQLERRKSTLLKVLETILEVQAPFLVSHDAGKLAALTQRDLSSRVGSDPSVINRLLAGKSVELPWGLEAPLRSFVPSPKSILKEKVRALAEEAPGASAESLRALIEKRLGARLSRRSVAQYLLELRGTA
jgi:hypothetical protein